MAGWVWNMSRQAVSDSRNEKYIRQVLPASNAKAEPEWAHYRRRPQIVERKNRRMEAAL
jgi:hypothetical protein